MTQIVQALARKWRPRSFEDLVGQSATVQALRNALRTGRLHHAYLFTGTRGVGKTTLARIMAKCFNCTSGVTDQPCGTCEACTAIDQGRFPDLLEVDAATNTKVEEMRELLDNAQYLPVDGRYKVYLIDEVHMLSRSAFNSMLKTLEEPPEHIKFILATTDPQKVPVTVLSRCLQFGLRPLTVEQISQRLAEILEREGLPYDLAALPLVAQAADGSLRDGLSFLDQAIAHGGGAVRLDSVRALLGAVERGLLMQTLQALAQRDGSALLESAQQVGVRGWSCERVLQELGRCWHDLALLQRIPEQQSALGIGIDLNPFLTCWSARTLQLFYQITLQARRDLPYAPDEAAGYRMALLRLLAFTPAATPGESFEGKPGSLGPELARSEAKSSPDGANLESGAAKPTQVTAPNSASKRLPPPVFQEWSELVERLQGMGMVQELARHCEFGGFNQGRLHLRLSQDQKHLAAYSEKLRLALEALMDLDFRLELELASCTQATPAQLQQDEQQRLLQEARANLTQDPFVQEVIAGLGAKLVESSIVPGTNLHSGETK